jgi:hypothetical protein
MKGDLHASLNMADEALGLWREIGDAYREANTEDDQGDTYGKLLRHFEAGKSYERAADAWIRADMCDAAVRGFFRAYEQYITGGHFEEAARGFEAAWTTVIERGTAKDSLRLLRVISPPAKPVISLLNLTHIVETAAPLFSTVENRLLVMDAVAALAAVCKHMSADIGDSLYAKFLRLLAEQSLETGSSNAVIALAFSIEQAPDAVINSPAFKEVCSALADGAPDLRYRNDNLAGERWTVILPAAKAPAFELLVAEKTPGVRAAAAVVVLLLWAKRGMIVNQIGKRKWRRIGVMFTALAVEEAKAQGIELPDVSPEFPGLLAQLSDPKDERQTPLPFFISGNFLTYADRMKDSRNRCSLWLTMLLYNSVVQNFTHFTIPQGKATKLRGEFMSDVFGLQGEPEENEKCDSDAGDDLFEGL